LGIGELIVNTIVWEQAKRLRSYELLARVFERQRVSESATMQQAATADSLTG
jgi:hypothetical protein